MFHDHIDSWSWVLHAWEPKIPVRGGYSGYSVELVLILANQERVGAINSSYITLQEMDTCMSVVFGIIVNVIRVSPMLFVLVNFERRTVTVYTMATLFFVENIPLDRQTVHV